jgi:hypothetical protein
MLLRYYSTNVTPEEISDRFGSAFLSSGFIDWSNEHRNAERNEAGEMMSCAHYLIETQFRSLSSDIVTTDMSKIKLSYMKRDIPVIVTGKLPMLSGSIPNTILIKGYVDEYMIVNDPRGNAMSGYRDKMGENMLYSVDNLSFWVSKTRTHVLRVLPNIK